MVADAGSVRDGLLVLALSGAVALLRETFVLGRSGEAGGHLRSLLRADLDGRSSCFARVR